MRIVDDIKPIMAGIGKSNAVFSSPGWAYDLIGMQYDAVGTPYGGSDRRQDSGGLMASIQDVKPENTFSNQFSLSTFKTITYAQGAPLGLLWYITNPKTITAPKAF